MQRILTTPRAGWETIVESQGMLFHTIEGEPYWDEGAYYLFDAREVDLIEAATYRLDEMCLRAVEHVVANELFGIFGIPDRFAGEVARSWEEDEHTIYGRFDLSYDGDGPPKLLEYNADTPTALLEAGVIQWFWFRDLLEGVGPLDRSQFDQFNGIHERLIAAWSAVARDIGGRVHFAALEESLEDFMTVSYLRDTAIQAGLETEFLAVGEIGWNAHRGAFTDRQERAIATIFKLYPWEWMVREPFGAQLGRGPTRWLEPPWKMILSNKAILPILHELFPDSPYLLRAGFEPIGDTYVVKPVLRGRGRTSRSSGTGRRSRRRRGLTRRSPASTRSSTRCRASRADTR